MKSVSSVVKQEIVRRVEGLFALADQLELRLVMQDETGRRRILNKFNFPRLRFPDSEETALTHS